jgi:hypothetical protein
MQEDYQEIRTPHGRYRWVAKSSDIMESIRGSSEVTKLPQKRLKVPPQFGERKDNRA